MVFTSFEYALLLTGTVLAFWAVPARTSGLVLGIASIAFYASWSIPYLALVAFSILTGYIAARAIDARRGAAGSAPRAPVVTAIVVLLGLLAYFKYGDFAVRIWDGLAGSAHSPVDIVLPLAISFYTFQVLAYVIDVHRGAAPERSLWRFALFVGFFPQLIAGPIVRAGQLLPQLRKRSSFDGVRALSGLELIAYGVLKKAVFADNLAVHVDRVFASPVDAGGLDIAVATLAFGAQIYCDFSGYTDIARGSGRLFGIELPANFRSPYLATSITDFWRRWHITLSTWLRDYLYIPLGGNRVGSGRLYANLIITMTLGGLWHGASFSFLLWGLYHGLLLWADRMAGIGRRERPILSPLRVAWAMLTFAAVQGGWLLFRAGDLANLAKLASAIAADPMGSRPELQTPAYLGLAAAVYALHGLSAALRRRPFVSEWLLHPALATPALASITALVVVFGGSSAAFIYFQF